tara:strand:+ start:83 stop:433 length:351 start_codon:yes stop_codon:yes gene_type:complete
MKITRQQLRKIISEASHLSFEKPKATTSAIDDNFLSPPMNFDKASALDRIMQAERLVQMVIDEVGGELFTKRHPNTHPTTKSNMDAAQMKLHGLLTNILKQLQEAKKIEYFEASGF